MSFDKANLDSVFNEEVEKYKDVEGVEVVRKTRLGVDVIESRVNGSLFEVWMDKDKERMYMNSNHKSTSIDNLFESAEEVAEYYIEEGGELMKLSKSHNVITVAVKINGFNMWMYFHTTGLLEMNIYEGILPSQGIRAVYDLYLEEIIVFE